MECLRILFAYLFDILKLYLRFGIITLLIYFVAQWYVLHYEDLDALSATATPEQRSSSNNTVNQLYRLVLDFFVI